MAFTPFKQWAEQDTESYIIANSQTLHIGDPISFGSTGGATGYVIPAVPQQTSNVYGVVVGFTASPGGSSQVNLTSSAVTALATNQSVDQYRARVLPVRAQRLFIADLSQTAGVTANSHNVGFFNIQNSNVSKLDETTYVVPPPTFQVAATVAQFFSLGSGLASTNNGVVGLFPITSSQVIGFFGNTISF